MFISLPQKARFFHQLATLLDSGFSLHHSLSMAGQGASPALQRSLQQASGAIAGGQDLATALSRYPQYFDSWTVNLIRLAEHSGSLAETCRRIAVATERQQKRNRIYRSASLALFGLLLSLLLCGLVLFRGSQVLLNPSFWLPLLLVLGLVGIMIRFQNARYFRQQLVQRIPLVGKLLQIRAMLYLTELALPLGCGVPILTAVELIRDRIPDPDLSAHLAIAARQIRAGHPLSRSLQGKIPPLAIQMIRTGEETGDLEGMLQKLAEYYENELETLLRQIQGTLRPLSILIFGVLVAVLGIQTITSMINSLPG